MAFQTVFKRYELKYMLTLEQKERVLDAMTPYMKQDEYGKTTIRNLYYDTDTYLLIRRSLEKNTYKEKLRIRSYDKAKSDSTVFVELKKKYQQVVYKRRLPLLEEEAMDWVKKCYIPHKHTQIAEEINYFLDYYKTLKPMAFISYERDAFYDKNDVNFRVTFDDNILCRLDDLSLKSEVYGAAILPKDRVLMEIKCSGGIPLWMTHILSIEHLYKTSFSKYGTAYQTLIYPRLFNNKGGTY